jgi:hypothetical protein
VVTIEDRDLPSDWQRRMFLDTHYGIYSHYIIRFTFLHLLVQQGEESGKEKMSDVLHDAAVRSSFFLFCSCEQKRSAEGIVDVDSFWSTLAECLVRMNTMGVPAVHTLFELRHWTLGIGVLRIQRFFDPVTCLLSVVPFMTSTANRTLPVHHDTFKAQRTAHCRRLHRLTESDCHFIRDINGTLVVENET